MPKTKISEFSSTPANNTDIDSINLAEGCAPSGINDAIRELMAQLKDFQTGAVGDSFNGPVGTTTAAAGAFTTLAASSTVTLSGGTANGVAYLNGSKVVTSGSALTFDGTNLGVGVSTAYARLQALGTIKVATGNAQGILGLGDGNGSTVNCGIWRGAANAPTTDGNYLNFGGYDGLVFAVGNAAIGSQSEVGRFTSTGLGIGTSSITGGYKLQVNGNLLLSSTTPLVVGNSTLTLLGDNTSSTGLLLNTAGNLGLGVTPSAWGSGQKAIQIGSTAVLYQPAARYLSLGSNFYDDGSNGRYLTNGHATIYQQNRDSGVHAWYTAPSGTAGSAITFTQAMTLDASGNLGVGTTSPNSKLNVNNGFLQVDISGTQAIRVGSTDSIVGGSDNNGILQVGTSKALLVYAGGSERARIDSSGNLLVGTTSQIGAGLVSSVSANNAGAFRTTAAANNYAAIYAGRNGNAGNAIELWYSSVTQVGTIAVTASATSYNTSSDYRLKNTIAPMTGALAKVAQLKPCTYKWNADGSDGEGFIAHELAEVCPHAVTGEKDAVDENGNPRYQGIDTSFLVATLTAAIQELKAEFDAYKASHP